MTTANSISDQNPNGVSSAYWMPFTSNRDFHKSPRMLKSAQGHYYHSNDGRKIYDSFSGLWTTGLGHCHPKISEAVTEQIRTMDYAISFQIGHDKAFELADRLLDKAPAGFGSVFYTNSGSEAADTALKIALAYHKANGAAQRTRLIGRERGYHGVNFGGLSVGGIGVNRNMFAANLMPGVDHIRHTFDLEHTAFSKGCPDWGAHLANDLVRICALHGSDTIAALIVEPVAGSTGILPPPVGYLKALRDLCTAHGILLIFDEVITAFGRVGSAFAAERFDVIPDIITTAKGLTNGAIPMGAVLVREEIVSTICQGPDHLPELFHGYTYSGHPVAAAAGLAAMSAYDEEDSFAEAKSREKLFEDTIHDLADHPLVVDVRNYGLMGAVELAPRDEAPGLRGLDVHKSCFWDEDLIIRNGGDILQFSPFLNATPNDIEMTFAKVRSAIDRVG